jgi:hypothetical protein
MRARIERLLSRRFSIARHCEERRDEAIQKAAAPRGGWIAALRSQ